MMMKLRRDRDYMKSISIKEYYMSINIDFLWIHSLTN